MRLIKSYGNHNYNTICSGYDFLYRDGADKIINKLGQLEDILEGHNIETLEELDGLLWYAKQVKDIEDEIGIDLITYFKLFKTTKVWAYSNNGKCEVTLTGVNPYDKMVNLWNGVCHIEYPFDEYGKSFALTKEELK